MSAPRVPTRLFELAAGYQRSKVLFALLELGVPGLLAGGAQTIDELARRLGVHPLATDRLLHAGVALGLLERDGNGFANAPDTARFLVPGAEHDVSEALCRMDTVSYPLWSDLTRRLREWAPGATSVPSVGAADALAGTRAQHNLSRLTGEALAEAFDFSPHRLLLDLGGGTGAMSIGVCARHEQLRALVVDQAPIAAAAREAVAAAGLADRIETRAGDFLADPLPSGFDVALLANLLSGMGEASTRALLRALYERLPSGGCVILSGWMLDDNRLGPLTAVLFCLEDINWSAPDVERTASRYAAWLADAGFRDLTQNLYAPPTRFLSARKP
jgi:3-hydroxy-5-methyl-1-naphthoate 3-O-methyltransferase